MSQPDVARVLEALGIPYRRQGHRLHARCPSHSPDRSPSWSIAWRGPAVGQHHCFVCGFAGGLVSLVAHARGYTGVRTPWDTDEDVTRLAREEARRWLAEVEEAAPEPVPEGVRVEVRPRAAFALPREVRCAPLAEWVTPAERYARRRGLTERQVARWGLGYAASGLLAGRLVVPVRDARGAARNYMARAYGQQAKRYLYPDAASRPDGAALFGEQHWPARDATGRRSHVVVCEGAFNALAVERALGERVPVAALGGSEVRPAHLAKLASFARVVVLTDADEAGEKAADELARGLARHSYVWRATSPAGGDIDEVAPAELVRAVEGEVFG